MAEERCSVLRKIAHDWNWYHLPQVDIEMCIVHIVILAVLLRICSGDIRFACLSEVEEKKLAPNKICSHKIIMERLPNCSINIAEVLTFPHTNGSVLARQLYFLTKVQSISLLTVKDENETVVSMLPSRCHKSRFKRSDRSFVCVENGARIQIPTRNISSKVVLTLTYQISNGVMRAEGPCSAVWRTNEGSNVIIWKSNLGVRSHDYQLVIYSYNYDLYFKQYGLDREFSRGALVTRLFRVPLIDQTFIEESGGGSCPEIMECYFELKVLPVIGIIVGCVLGSVVVVWGVCCTVLRWVSLSERVMKRLEEVGIVKFEAEGRDDGENS